MAKTYEVAIKLAGQLTGGFMKAFSQASDQVNKLGADMEKLHAREEKLAKQRVAFQRSAEKIGSNTRMAFDAVSVPVKEAISFESAMADAAKTIDGMRDDTGKLTKKYDEMQGVILSMGRSLPLSHQEIAALFAAGGQQGMTDVAELQNFATMAAHMSVAFGMSTQEAADAIGGFRTAMGLSFDDTRTMLDLMNQFANTTSASEKGIAEVVRRIGSLGGVAGVKNKELTALAATLDSMKVSPEIAATGLKNFMLALVAGDAATKKQAKAFESLGLNAQQLSKDMQVNASGTIVQVLEKIAALSKDKQLSTMQEIFGKESLGAIAPMLDQLDLVKKNFAQIGDESKYAGAMQQEFSNRNDTTAAGLQLFNNRMTELSITVGKNLLPALTSLAESLGPIVSKLAEFVRDHQDLTKIFMGVTGACFVLSPLLSTVGGSMKILGAVTGKSGGALSALSGTMGKFAMAGGPLALAAGGIYLLYKNSDDFRMICDDLMKGVGSLALVLGEKLGGALATILEYLGKTIDGFMKLIGLGETAKGVKAAKDKMEAAGVDTDDTGAVIEYAQREMASGGIVTGPTHALIGEGREPEAVLPLSKLSSMLGGTSGMGGMNVSFSPVINVNGGGSDAYDQVKRGLSEGRDSLRRELERLMSDQRRLSYV